MKIVLVGRICSNVVIVPVENALNKYEKDGIFMENIIVDRL